MSAPTQTAFLDKIDATIMGMHSGLPPDMLTRQHLAFAVNITNRGGKPKTRSKLRKLAVAYADEDTETLATEARFQGAAYYSAYGNFQNALIASIGGKIFRYLINGDNVSVGDISPPGVINDPTRPQAWLWQAEDFMIVNDGFGLPIFFDGAGTRRSLGPAGNELPVGTMGHYVNGRVVMVLPDRRSFMAGDLVYGISGTPAYNYRDSILKITENIAILGGRSFAVPINAGPINALFSVAIPDTSLGQGPLQIGTRKGVFSVNLPLDAQQWTTTLQPTSTVSLPAFGPLSFYGVVAVNGDAWYRGLDGIRSFTVARRDFNTWVQTPMSFEMEKVIKFDTDYLLDHTSCVNFDNRLLTTCSPYRVEDRGVAHRGLMALDFCNVSSMTTRSQPSYDGLWTGLPILQMVVGEFGGSERCFVFALDEDEKICLYELLKDGVGLFDFDGEEEVPIESWLISNALFGLQEYPDRITGPMKKLLTADFFFEQLGGEIDFVVKYRSDQWPFWVDWKSFEVCAPFEDCETSECRTFADVQQQYATFLRMPDPPDECNPITKRLQKTGYYFQIRLQWTGHVALEKAYVWADPIKETIPGCPPTQECQLLTGCTDNLFSYSIEG